jgi:uncharacterized membrane protein
MKLMVIVFLGLLSALAARAAPFLVCDAITPSSDPALNPVSYTISGLASSPVSTPATQNADGTIQLHYDLASLANGNYTVSAAAVNTFGAASPLSATLTFTKGAPGTPQNLRISPN